MLAHAIEMKLHRLANKFLYFLQSLTSGAAAPASLVRKRPSPTQTFRKSTDISFQTLPA